MHESFGLGRRATSVLNAARRRLASPLVLTYLILLLALAMRVGYWRVKWDAPYFPYGDDGGYYEGGVSLARGVADFWTSDAWHLWQRDWIEPPLYPVALSGLVRLLGEDVLALRLFQTLVGTLCVALVYRLGHVLFSLWVGVGAALMAALYIPLVTLPIVLMAENLFILLLLAAFVLLAQFTRSRSRRDLFLAGLLLALASLTRSNSSLFIFMAAGWLVALAGAAWKRALVYLVVFGAAVGLIFLPWTVRNYALYNRFLPTDTMAGANIWRQELVTSSQVPYQQNPVDRQTAALSQAARNIIARPGLLTDGITLNARHLVRLEAVYLFAYGETSTWSVLFSPYLVLDDGLLVLTCLGLLFGLVYARNRPAAVLWALWLAYTILVLVVFFHVEIRYRWPTVSLVLPFAAYGISIVYRRALRPLLSWRNAVALGGALVILALMFWDYPARFAQLIARDQAVTAALSAAAHGEIADGENKVAEARQVDSVSVLPDLAWGDWNYAAGDTARALEAYQRAEKESTWAVEPLVRLGNLYRATGRTEEAARVLEPTGIDEAPLLDYSFQHPEFLAVHPNRVDVGRQDQGLVRSVSPIVTDDPNAPGLTFRWTERWTQVRLYPSSPARVLNLRMNGWRPGNMPRPRLLILVNGKLVGQLEVKKTWQVYHFRLPLDLATSRELVVTLQSDTWLPYDPNSVAAQPRRGVMLDWVQVGAESTNK